MISENIFSYSNKSTENWDKESQLLLLNYIKLLHPFFLKIEP